MFPVSNFNNRLKITRNGPDNLFSRCKDDARGLVFESDSNSAESSPIESHFPYSFTQEQNDEFTERKCSSCSCRKSTLSRKRDESSTSAMRERNKNMRYVTFHQQEAKLYNLELEDAERLEELGKIQAHFDRTSQILEALILYSQSLDLKARSFIRLTSLTEDFAYKDITHSEALSEILDKMELETNLLKRLSELQTSLLETSRTPEQVYQLQEDFREARKLQLNATTRYIQCLRSCGNVSASRLSRYEGRFETIRADCDRSRRDLEEEFRKLINDREEAIVQGLSKLTPVLDHMRKKDNQFCLLCREIVESLRGTFKKQSTKRNYCVSKQPLPQHHE